jgi:signal transduction histidine kinase
VLEEHTEQEGAALEEETLQVLDLVHVLRRVETFVSDIAEKSGIPVSVWAQKPQMLVRAEYFSMLRMFYQIFENAFKYLEFGNSVQIQLYDAGEDILIVYKDNGHTEYTDDMNYIMENGSFPEKFKRK